MRPARAGALLREWRGRRRMTQLDVALEAGISARHLSFLETGRARASRGMLLRLGETLDIPLRERNRLLVAAGLAPEFRERPLVAGELAAARHAIDLVLEAQKPFPAFALDRHWNAVAGNGALPEIFEGVSPELLAAPVNVLRLSLHPQGLAPRIANLTQWRAHLLTRLRRQLEVSGDPALGELLREASAYPAASAGTQAQYALAVPLRLRVPGATLSFFSTTTVFGTPLDVTLSELAIELFFPADEATARYARGNETKQQYNCNIPGRAGH
jgi:transcriptional regulator with XRE-family HTH domain